METKTYSNRFTRITMAVTLMAISDPNLSKSLREFF